jgi:two-component system, LytTR family, response regulator
MKLLIVDKDIDTRLKIKVITQSFNQISEVLESPTAEDALFSVYENEPSVMIISNDLPNRKGFDLAYLLNKQNHPIQIIVISECKDEAIDAIRAKVADFVVHPFRDRALTISIRKVLLEMKSHLKTEVLPNSGVCRIKISTIMGFQLIDLKEVAYCVADGAYTKIVFRDDEFILSSVYLAKIEKILEEHHFIKINRSCIINLRLIKEVDAKDKTCVLDMINSTEELKISKVYFSSFEKKYLIR